MKDDPKLTGVRVRELIEPLVFDGGQNARRLSACVRCGESGQTFDVFARERLEGEYIGG